MGVVPAIRQSAKRFNSSGHKLASGVQFRASVLADRPAGVCGPQEAKNSRHVGENHASRHGCWRPRCGRAASPGFRQLSRHQVSELSQRRKAHATELGPRVRDPRASGRCTAAAGTVSEFRFGGRAMAGERCPGKADDRADALKSPGWQPVLDAGRALFCEVRMTKHEPETEKGSGDGDLSEIFDLDRKGLTRKMVDNIETCLRDVQTAQEDLKQIVASCKEAQFSRRDIWAMKEIAKLRLKDQGGRAREQLEALERIGHAVGFDLFDWAASRS